MKSVRWFIGVINCGFLRNSLTIFDFVLPPFCFSSANINASLILNLNFGLIGKFANGLVQSKRIIFFIK